MSKLLKISAGGQVSVPAKVRKRWKTQAVIAEDHGDALILRPAIDDPIAAAQGSLAEFSKGMPEAATVIRDERDREAQAAERRWSSG